MKNRVFIFIAVCSMALFSCQNESGLSGEIAKLEKEVESSPTVDGVNNLVTKYNQYIKENPDDAEWNGRYLYRAAAKQLQTNNLRGTVQFLNDGIKRFGTSSATPNSIYLLAETYKNKFRQTDQAEVYYQALVEAYPSNPYAEKAKGNLKDSKTLSERIEVIKSDIYMDSTQTRVNPNKARNLVDMYMLHASLLPDHPKSPMYLYDTYEIANSVRMFRDAAAACEKLYKDYPEHEKAPTALFLTGYLYENELKDMDKAKNLYTTFLEKYPENEFAKSAKFALDNLGIPPDQLLEKLKKNNEGK